MLPYYLAKHLRSRPPVLQRQFGYSETDLKPCLRLLYPAYISAEKSVLQAARKKYASAAFFEVSLTSETCPSCVKTALFSSLPPEFHTLLCLSLHSLAFSH